MPKIECIICKKIVIANRMTKKYCYDCNPYNERIGRKKKVVEKIIRVVEKIIKRKRKIKCIKVKLFFKQSEERRKSEAELRRIKKILVKPLECQECDKMCNRLALHHIDKNRSNNHISNLIYLCYPCHRLKHPELPDKLFL